MNVAGTNTRISDGSLSRSVSAEGQSGAKSIMDLGSSDAAQATSPFRKHFEAVVRANTNASNGRDSLNEHPRCERKRMPDREVIDSRQNNADVPTETQRPLDSNTPDRGAPTDRGNDAGASTQNNNENQAESSNGTIQNSNNANDAASSDHSDNATSSALAAASTTAPVSPVQAPPQPDAVDQVAPSVNPDAAKQAADILTSTIVNVSEALSAKISEGVYHLDLTKPGDADAKEIGEILYSLKSITAILDKAVQNNDSVDVKGAPVQGSELAGLDNLLHQSVFNIQAAVNLLGLSQKVASNLSEMSGVSAMQGITLAADPVDKAMPTVYLERISAMVTAQAGSTDSSGSQPTLQALLDKLTGLLKDDGGKSGATPAVVLTQRAAEGQSAVVTPLAQVKPFDSSVMRAVLKIDTVQAAAAENAKAAEATEKMDLPKTQGIVMGRDLLDQTQADSSAQDSSVMARLLDMAAKPADATSLLAMPDAPQRTDQAVVTQLVQNFSSMLKIGSHEMKIMLHPRELGDVHLSVKVNGDVVVTKIQVESQQVKQIVEASLPALKSALAEHDLKSGSVTVDVNTGAQRDLADGRASHTGDHEQHSPSGTPAGTETGEVVVHQAGEGTKVDLGHDTGRRYGSNSMEYYA